MKPVAVTVISHGHYQRRKQAKSHAALQQQVSLCVTEARCHSAGFITAYVGVALIYSYQVSKKNK